MNKINVWKSKPHYFILILLLLVMTIFLSAFIFKLHKIVGVNPNTETEYSVIDLMTNDVFDFFNQDSSLSKLKSLFAELNSRWGASYYVASKQPVFITDNQFPNEFIYGYGDLPEEYLDPNALFSYQLNHSAIKGFALSTYEGRLFLEDDYLLAEDGYLPIIVGYDYKDLLSIGDVLQLEYLNIIFDCSVVGILEDGNKIKYNSLNRYIILPALEHESPVNDDEKTAFLQKMYLNHTNGMIITEEKPITIQRFLDASSSKYDLPSYTIIGMPIINIFNIGIANSILLLQVSAAFILVLSIFLCIFIYRKKIRVLANH